MASSPTEIVITAKDETRAAFQSAQAGLAALTQSASSLPMIGASLAGAFSVGAFAASIKSTIDYAGRLHDLSMQTGVTVEALSSLKGIAALSGTSMDDVAGSAEKLVKNMTKAASGSKEQAAAFDALGISILNAKGGLRDSGDVYKDVAKAIAELQNPTERAAAAQLVFGKAGAKMVPMLMDLAAAGELVTKVTTEQAAMADNVGDNMTRLQAVYQGTARVVALEMLPAIDTFVESLLQAAVGTGSVKKSISELAKSGELKEWADEAAKAAAFVIDAFDGVSRVVKGIGFTVAAAAAQMAQLGKGNFEGAKTIGDEWIKDLEKLALAPQFSDRLAANMADPYRHWTEKEKDYATKAAEVMKAYSAMPLEVQQKAMQALSNATFGDPGKQSGFAKMLENLRKSESGTEKITDYQRITQELEKKTAVASLDLATTEKLTEAQKRAAEFESDLALGKLKMTDREILLTRARLAGLDALQRSIEKEKEAAKVELMLNDYRKNNQTMIERINREAELALMTDRQRAAAEALYRVEDEAAKMRERILRDIPEEVAQKEALAKVEEELALQKERVTAAVNKSQDTQHSFEFGWQKAFNNYADNANNSAKIAGEAFASMSSAMENSIVNFVSTGKLNFKDFANSVLSDMARIAARQAVSGLFGGALGKFFGGAADAGSSDAASWLNFAGGRASGGPVIPGNYYVVGENGPEVLVPNTAGTVIPAGGGMGGGSTSNVTINIDASGTKTEGDAGNARELGRRIESAVRSVLMVEQRPGGMLA